MPLNTGAIYGDAVGERYVKALWFESISSGTSGTFSAPTQGTIVLDQWAAGVDALASKISSGVPSYESPLTSGGVIVTATLDVSGAWTLSGTPSAYPVAIVYCYQVKLRYFDSTKSLGAYELMPQAGGVFTDVSAFNGILSSTDSTVQKALDTIDGHGHSYVSSVTATTPIISSGGTTPDISLYAGPGAHNLSVYHSGITPSVLYVFAKSSAAAPSESHPVIISIGDGNIGYYRDTGEYLSGARTFTLADGAGLWGRASSTETRFCYLYAIGSGTHIVYALAGYAGFINVPTTTTASDDDYFLLEDSSTYSRYAPHYCACVARIPYVYNTSTTPDHTLGSPKEIVWNPKSDYARQVNLATTISSASDISTTMTSIVKQPGKYHITAHVSSGSTNGSGYSSIRVGSSTFSSATQVAYGSTYGAAYKSVPLDAVAILAYGDTIHLFLGVTGDSGTRYVYGDSGEPGSTTFCFHRI